MERICCVCWRDEATLSTVVSRGVDRERDEAEVVVSIVGLREITIGRNLKASIFSGDLTSPAHT